MRPRGPAAARRRPKKRARRRPSSTPTGSGRSGAWRGFWSRWDAPTGCGPKTWSVRSRTRPACRDGPFGAIDIYDRFAFVDVPQQHAARVVDTLRHTTIRGSRRPRASRSRWLTGARPAERIARRGRAPRPEPTPRPTRLTLDGQPAREPRTTRTARETRPARPLATRPAPAIGTVGADLPPAPRATLPEAGRGGRTGSPARARTAASLSGNRNSGLRRLRKLLEAGSIPATIGS